MPSLEELVQDLYHGRKEIDVPKSSITEPITNWKISKYNIPHKGSKGAMRLGKLHAHDMGDHYSVHLDKVDPDTSPFGHLAVDAPFLFFIFTGFVTIWQMLEQSVAEESGYSRVSRLSLGFRILSGLFLVILGIILTINPNFLALGTFLLLSLAAIGFGAFTLMEGLFKGQDGVDKVKVALGAVLIIVGAVGLAFHLMIALVLVLFLAFWNLFTGIYMLRHRKDGSSPFKGHISIIMGLTSLALGILLLYHPWFAIEIIFSLVGVLIAFFGVIRIIGAFTIDR
ncbi:MAG: hypothetical protein GXX95_00220 [Methanomassiliicoccus sp.]|nr:hypothetical protein [Methanomassiliicoccus sp.]